VLADEPTGNLDTKNSDAVLHMLLRSNRELGQTTLMITHNPEAASIASRILYMRDGEIVREERGSRADTALAAPGAAPAADRDEMQTLNLVASPVETIQDGRS
jgi:putative ABC transport system ATP-binding protein